MSRNVVDAVKTLKRTAPRNSIVRIDWFVATKTFPACRMTRLRRLVASLWSLTGPDGARWNSTTRSTT